MESDDNVVFTSKKTIRFDVSTPDAKLVGKYFNAKTKNNLDICYRCKLQILINNSETYSIKHSTIIVECLVI